MPLTGLFDPKRSGSRGFHEGIFDAQEKIPESRESRDYGETEARNDLPGNPWGRFYRIAVPVESKMGKRMDMGMNGFHGDTFSSGFGDFSTARRKRIMGNSNGFYGDTFSDGFGDFSTAKRKRSMGMNAFHGDTFSHGFGDFETV